VTEFGASKGEGTPLERGHQRGIPFKKSLFNRYWLV